MTAARFSWDYAAMRSLADPSSQLRQHGAGLGGGLGERRRFAAAQNDLVDEFAVLHLG